jgi:hypothetical protein
VLNINELAVICQNLFDFYLVVSKETPENDSEFILTLLQKYVTIKMFYFGNEENKIEFFQFIKSGIIQLIELKQV